MKNYKKGSMVQLVLILLAIVLVGGIYYFLNYSKPQLTIPANDIIEENSVICAMDVKLCSNGSYVGRTGPNCEFICPNVKVESPAKRILQDLMRQNGVNYDITNTSRDVWFFDGIKKMDGYSIFSRGNKIPYSTFFTSKGMNIDIRNYGDATFSGSMAYRDNNIICVIQTRVVDYVEGMEESQMTFENEVFCAEHDSPLQGQSSLELLCNTQKCDVSGVNSWRSDFYIKDSGKNIKVLVDSETRLRNKIGENESFVIKWADFYPLISNPILGKPFNGAIYGDWVDSNTFKANWIMWPAWPRG